MQFNHSLGISNLLTSEYRDILPLVFSYFNAKDIYQISLVNRTFHGIIKKTDDMFVSFEKNTFIDKDVINRCRFYGRNASFAEAFDCSLKKIKNASLVRLQDIHIDEAVAAILKGLPEQIKRLEISHCSSDIPEIPDKFLPKGIFDLSGQSHLVSLQMRNCTEIKSVKVARCVGLQDVTLSLPDLIYPPDFSNLDSLKIIDTEGCEKLSFFPRVDGCSNLEKTSFYRRPESHSSYTFASDY